MNYSEIRPMDNEHDSTYWLAMLIRQGLKLIVAGIERRYRVGQFKPKRERAAIES